MHACMHVCMCIYIYIYELFGTYPIECMAYVGLWMGFSPNTIWGARTPGCVEPIAQEPSTIQDSRYAYNQVQTCWLPRWMNIQTGDCKELSVGWTLSNWDQTNYNKGMMNNEIWLYIYIFNYPLFFPVAWHTYIYICIDIYIYTHTRYFPQNIPVRCITIPNLDRWCTRVAQEWCKQVKYGKYIFVNHKIWGCTTIFRAP